MEQQIFTNQAVRSSMNIQFEDGILIKDYIKMMAYMIVLCFTLAISLSFWVLSITASTYYGTLQPVSPWRWLFSVLVPLFITFRAFKRRSLDHGGAIGVGSAVGRVVFWKFVASYAGEEVGACGSRDSHPVVSAQRKNENKREQQQQSSIRCKDCKH